MRTCANFPKCSRTAIRGGKLCAKCFGATRKPTLAILSDREQLIEDSGLPVSAAGGRWLRAVDRLSWTDLKGLVADLVDQNTERGRLAARDR